ncbi:hypothetical protein MMPV_002934 [Pyropia vietnamensis]
MAPGGDGRSGDGGDGGGGGDGGRRRRRDASRSEDVGDDDAAALATRFAREAVRRGLPSAATPPRPSALVPPPVALTAALEALQAGDVATAYAFAAPPPGAQAAEARVARSDWSARPGGGGVTFLRGGVTKWAAAVLGIGKDGRDEGREGGPASAAAPPGAVLLHATHVALDGPPVFWEPSPTGGGAADVASAAAATPDGEPWAEEDRLVQLVRVWPAAAGAAAGRRRPPSVLVRVGMVRQAEGAYRGCWLVEGVAVV